MRSFIRFAPVAAAACSLLLAAGCGGEAEVAAGGDAGVAEEVAINDPWSRQPAQGQTATAVYGEVINPTDEDLTIVAASSPVTEQVELHETTMADDGVMRMEEREDGFVVPAGGRFVLEPGGPHIMLLDIDAASYPDTVEVTLEFDQADPLTFEAEVRAIAGNASMDHGGHGDAGHGDTESGDADKPDHATDTTEVASMDESKDEAKDEIAADGTGELDVSALHEIDEQLAAGTLDVTVQRAVVADYIAAVEAMNPQDGSGEAELLAALEELDDALAAGDLAEAAALAARAHNVAHDLGHGHGHSH